MYRRCRTSEVVNLVYLGMERLGNIVPDQFEPWIAHQMNNIPLGTCKEIIQAENLIALVNQTAAKMGSDKSGPSGNEDSLHCDDSY